MIRVFLSFAAGVKRMIHAVSTPENAAFLGTLWQRQPLPPQDRCRRNDFRDLKREAGRRYRKRCDGRKLTPKRTLGKLA
jgi:hypothetical protein